MELWAGPECSVARVGDSYRDQSVLTGHEERIDDLERLASLGVRRVRYPVLWERVAPDAPDRCDWRWTDSRLQRIRELGMAPIAGLVHHGSGPRYTDLLDAGFAPGLAAFARRAAERYPWIEAWTPVNEPLTTARFSALYGFWYPHHRSDLSFVRAFLNELRAVVAAMRAIREIIPGARLVQTEDLGYAHATPALRRQADFENHRRWLTFDALCGRIDRDHPMWDYLLWAGAGEAELLAFAVHPCPPGVVGINHYLTSERFLDERLERYPAWTHGGNLRQRYVDVEAVRVLHDGMKGPRALLAEACDRYRLPVAVTEVHNGCTREEQVRWFAEIWHTASCLRDSGYDVSAVTLWSAFGAVDWNSLLMCEARHYEPGAWDVRAPRPRPTRLAEAVRELAAGRTFDHPVLDEVGWWHRPERVIYADPETIVDETVEEPHPQPTAEPRRLLITGATGTLGRAFARVCTHHGLPHRLLDRKQMDIADQDSVDDALDRLRPWAVINTAGFVRVDKAECNSESCWRENVVGPEILARACAARGLPLVTFSSDLVFDGSSRRPYVESDAPSPTTVYGRTKLEAEKRVGEIWSQALIIRTSAFFGPWDPYNLPTRLLRALVEGETVDARDDLVVSPTYVPDLVEGTLDLLVDGESGVWHLANQGALSWYALVATLAHRAGLDARRIRPVVLAGSGPSSTVLGSERASLLPPLDDALSRFVAARPWLLPLPHAARGTTVAAAL